MVRWREPGIAAALGSGEHAIHLLCRSTSIIPIRIVAIYMTDTSLLYPYSLSNQNQTDPIIYYLFLVDLEGVEPSSLILSWYYQQVVFCESRRFRAFNQMVLSLQHTPYNMNNNFKEQLLLFMLTNKHLNIDRLSTDIIKICSVTITP